MGKTRIVFIHPSQLSERWLNYYHLDELRDIFDVEYWDCSAIACPSFKASEIRERPYVSVIRGMDDFKRNVYRIPGDSLIVNDLHVNAANYRIYACLAGRFTHRVYVDFFANTQGVHKSRLLSKLATSGVRDLACYALTRMRFRFYVLGSRRGPGVKYRINHPDYELYRSAAEVPSGGGPGYVVYVDNFFPFHPDILKRDSRVDPARLALAFHASLNSFFSEVERCHGCRVVIAAHPSSVYDGNPFGGREIVHDRTCELIKGCKAACMHTSNALSFAILFDKPLALLTNGAFRQARLEQMRLENISRMLSMGLTDTDVPGGAGRAFNRVDGGFAARYKDEYLIADPVRTNAGLFADYFQSLHDEIYRTGHGDEGTE